MNLRIELQTRQYRPNAQNFGAELLKQVPVQTNMPRGTPDSKAQHHFPRPPGPKNLIQKSTKSESRFLQGLPP